MACQKKRLLESLPDNVALNFINLFEVEITDRLTINTDYWHFFDNIVDPTTIQEYIDKKDDGLENVEKDFYRKLIDSGKIIDVYLKLMEYLYHVDQELYNIFSIDTWEKESSSLFLKFLNAMDMLMPYFDLQKVIDYLGQYSFTLKTEYGKVIDRWRSGDISEKHAKSLIIRTICIMYDSSTYHLMYAILKCSDEAKRAVEKLFPEFELYYVRNIFEDRDGIFHVIDQYDNIGDAIKTVMNSDNHSKYSVNVLFDYIPRYHIAPLFYGVTKNPPLNLRNYQLELAQSALHGKNTVLCAPTGSGKTVIAAYVIRDHVIELRKKAKDPKIAFIVPTVPLVDQQMRLINHYLKNILVSKTICGADNGLTMEELASADIFFMTAKVLVNAANFDGNDRGSYYVALSNFTMIILDEAHHTVSLHPYNELMTIYRQEKYGNEDFPIKRMPQILAMTASLGTSKTKDLNEVKSHIITMCANVDAETISRTVHHLDELKKFTSETADEIIHIPTNENSTLHYRNYVCELKEYFEKEIRNIDGIKGIHEDILFKGCMAITNIGYIGWVKDSSENLLPRLVNLTPSVTKEARYCFYILEILYWALRCVTGFPTDETTNIYFKNRTKVGNKEHEEKVNEFVRKIEELPVVQPEIFTNLLNTLKYQFDNDPDSRIVVFVVKRQYCQIGVQSVMKALGINCGYITGVNSCLKEGGQTIREQKKVLTDFRNGTSPVLFATTVADEGLDIARCNLVIKYNLVTDEIAHVQRKGRARQLKSRCFLMTGDEKLVEQEKLNKELVVIMEQAHEELNKLSETEIEIMIKKSINEINVKRLEAERLQKDQITKLAPFSDDYNILCKDCVFPITNSEFVRVFHSHFVIADTDIWKKVGGDALSENQADRLCRRGFVGNVICKGLNGTCGHNLGKIIVWGGITLPVFSCDKIIFAPKGDSNASNRKTFKKWKSVTETLFYPKGFTEYEEMRNAEGRPIGLMSKVNDDVDLEDVDKVIE